MRQTKRVLILTLWADGGVAAMTRTLRERQLAAELAVKFDDCSPGDHEVFVCDTERLHRVLSWQPTVGTEQGVLSLIQWVRGNQELFRD